MVLPSVAASAQPSAAGFVGNVVLTLDGDALVVHGQRHNPALALLRSVVAYLLVCAAMLVLLTVGVVAGALLLTAAAVTYASLAAALRRTLVDSHVRIQLSDVQDLQVATVRTSDLLYWIGWVGVLAAPAVPAVAFRAPLATGTRPVRWIIRTADTDGEGRLVAWLATAALDKTGSRNAG